VDQSKCFLSAFEELRQIYAAADREIAAASAQCQQCGGCCNFDRNGMRLYIYALERIHLEFICGKGLELCHGVCSGQNQTLCHIHAIRPLGCRTQFCTITLQEIYEKYAQKIRALEQKYKIDYDYSNAFET